MEAAKAAEIALFDFAGTLFAVCQKKEQARRGKGKRPR